MNQQNNKMMTAVTIYLQALLFRQIINKKDDYRFSQEELVILKHKNAVISPKKLLLFSFVITKAASPHDQQMKMFKLYGNSFAPFPFGIAPKNLYDTLHNSDIFNKWFGLNQYVSAQSIAHGSCLVPITDIPDLLFQSLPNLKIFLPKELNVDPNTFSEYCVIVEDSIKFLVSRKFRNLAELDTDTLEYWCKSGFVYRAHVDFYNETICKDPGRLIEEIFFVTFNESIKQARYSFEYS